MKNLKRRLEYFIKHNRAAHWLYINLVSLAVRVIGLFVRVDDRLVLFTGLGMRYNDSPRAIFEYMREHALTERYRCIWAVDEPEKYAIDGAEIIAVDTPKYFLTALRARYWVACVNIERGLHFKKKKTVFLNTWHGAAINAMGNAVGGRHDFDWRHTDFVCCSGEYEKEILVRDCRARRENLIETGLPRNDRLYRTSEEEKRALRERLGLPSDKKVVLYAPTWRDSTDGGIDFKLTCPIDCERFARELGDRYVLAIHSHWITTSLDGVAATDCVFDFSSHPDINDLLIAADLLISDYSSIILDYAILCRPIICFGYDFDEYTAARPLYFDAETTLPGGVVRTEDALIARLRTLDFDAECEASRAFRDSHVTFGGDATRRCVEYLFGSVEK